MKTHFLVLLIVACLICGCGRSEESEWVEGGLYSTLNENGTCAVIKILKIDDEGVHVRIYSNQFPEYPTDIDESELYMAGVDRKPSESLGMGHLPISKQSFLTWEADYIKTVDVTEEELEGYKMWLDAEGGFF